jgi:hypothetical protein
VTEDYVAGAQANDVHHHYCQGILALEARWTTWWDWRFFQTFLEVDAYVAYKRFCPGKQDVTHNHFLPSVIEYNKIGVPDSVPVCGPEPPELSRWRAVVGVHDLRYFANSEKKRGVC